VAGEELTGDESSQTPATDWGTEIVKTKLKLPSLITRHSPLVTILFCLLTCLGCGKEKTTAELIGDLKSQQEKEKLTAVRLLPEHEGDAAQAIPALIEALKDKEGRVRRSAAIGLGQMGAEAKEAIPALQGLQRDHDARIREAAGIALSRIDPTKYAAPTKTKSAKGK
jgi:HEAT repeats